jgi:hypothetical protein
MKMIYFYQPFDDASLVQKNLWGYFLSIFFLIFKMPRFNIALMEEKVGCT